MGPEGEGDRGTCQGSLRILRQPFQRICCRERSQGDGGAWIGERRTEGDWSQSDPSDTAEGDALYEAEEDAPEVHRRELARLPKVRQCLLNPAFREYIVTSPA